MGVMLKKLSIPPVSMSFPDAVEYTGLGRSTLYKLAGEGKLTMVKIGRRSLLVTASLDALVEPLAA